MYTCISVYPCVFTVCVHVCIWCVHCICVYMHTCMILGMCKCNGPLSFLLWGGGLHTDSLVPGWAKVWNPGDPMGSDFHLHGTTGVRPCLLGPWLLSCSYSLPQTPLQCREICGHQSCRSTTKPSHMHIRIPQSSQTKPMRSNCWQTLTNPKTVYKNPIQKD
jgi:hypothetical protein